MSHGPPVHHENGLYCGPAVGPGDVGILLVPRESVLSLTRELPVPRTVAPSTPSRIAAEEAPRGASRPEPSLRRDAGGLRAALPPRSGDVRGLLPALPVASAGLLRRGLHPVHRRSSPGHAGALCPGPRARSRPSSPPWPSWMAGASPPSARTAAGGCARPRCSSVGSPASRRAQLSSSRGQVGGGNAASVRRGNTGNRCRMCVVVIKILKLS